MIAHFVESPWDPFRVLLISAMGLFLGHIIFACYISIRRRWTYLSFGTASAIIFVFDALTEEIGRLGHPIHYHFVIYTIGTILGLIAARHFPYHIGRRKDD